MGGLRTTEDGGEAEIPNLDLTEMAIDKDVIALEISVDNWRIMGMEINQTLQDLPSPFLDCPDVDAPVSLPVPDQNLSPSQSNSEP